ncbi:putative membrane protein [Agrococcus sp. UYP33]
MGWIGRRGWLVLFALAIVVQLLGLYAPRAPSGGGLPGVDKVAHAAMFLAPALLGLLAGIRPVVLAPLLIIHAVVSEVVQHLVLAERSGDPWDAVADIVGVAIGLAVGDAVLLRARDRRSAGPASGGAPRGSGGPPHSP